jgi:hypothetical protein
MASKNKIMWILLGALVVFGAVVAGDVRTQRVQPVVHQTPPPPPVTAGQTQAATGGEQVKTQLPAEFEALNNQFAKQSAALESQFKSATNPDDQASLQRQIMDVKQAQQLAQLNLALQKVRAKGDSEAEARILAKIENITHPPVHAPGQIARDPNTGLPVEGGAK